MNNSSADQQTAEKQKAAQDAVAKRTFLINNSNKKLRDSSQGATPNLQNSDSATNNMEQLRGEIQMMSPLSHRSVNNGGALGTNKPGHCGLVQDVSNKNSLLTRV